MQHPNTVAVEWASRALLSIFSCKIWRSTFDFLVQFLVLYFRFSRAISRALLSIFSCKIWCSTFDFLVQFLVLYFRFSRAISRALLSIFSCNFWCDCYRDISPKKMKHKKTKKTVPVCTWLFQNKSKPVEITTSHFVSGQFFNSALYVSCGGRCM